MEVPGNVTRQVNWQTSRLPKDDLDLIVERARGAWEDLRGSRVFLTGGTGFVGTWVLESFVRANRDLALDASIAVLSRDPTRFLGRRPHLRNEPAVTFVTGDVRDFDIHGVEFTHLIHGATTPGAPMDPREMFSVIVDGTRRVLEACRRVKPARSLLISSGAIYGRQPPEISHVSEDYEGAPSTCVSSSAYGEGKRAAELLATMATECDGIPFSIARCFAFVGPLLPLDAHFAIGNFMGDVLAGRDIVIRGDGTVRRSYMHAADLVIWLLNILVRGAGVRAYNVGSEHDVSIKDTADVVQRIAQSMLLRSAAQSIVTCETPRSGRSVARYVPNCQRAMNELSLPPIIPLSDAVRMTLAFYSRSTSVPHEGGRTGD